MILFLEFWSIYIILEIYGVNKHCNQIRASWLLNFNDLIIQCNKFLRRFNESGLYLAIKLLSN